MDTVIIGAGLAGLTAAATLRKAGSNVLVLEADRQIGGRIRALRDLSSQQALADLGPSWVWPKYQPLVTRWLDDLGLEPFEQFSDGDAVITGYGPEALRQPLPGQDGMVRIAGGPAALVDALARRVGDASIRTSAPVRAVLADGAGGLRVQLESGEVIRAPRAILAVPLRIAHETLEIPGLPEALRAAMRGTSTWMATQAKAVALYEKPFWRDAGLSGRIASRSGPLAEAHDHCGPDGTPAAIFGFVAWAPGRRSNDPEGLRRAIVEQLVECFGEEAGQPLQLVIQDWSQNNRIATELDHLQPAGHPQIGPEILRQPQLGGRLQFAVSEASTLSPGLIEGALAIGEQVALTRSKVKNGFSGENRL